MGAIYKRELKSYFTSPIGYVVLAIFFVFAGLFFTIIFQQGSPDLSPLFSSMFMIVLFIIPILTMRIFSDEKRQKTDQLLYTSPVKLSGIVMGKYLAALTVFGIGVGITILYQVIIAFFITPDWMVYLGNLLGMLLLAASLIAVGMFISALTESQLVAAVGSFAVSLILWLMDSLAQMINVSFVTKAISWVSFNGRYEAFTTGTLDYSNIVFFLSFAAIFIFLTVRVLDRKRWA